MNVLLICPTPVGKSLTVQTWRSCLTPQDQLFMLTLSKSNTKSNVGQMYGCNIYTLEINTTKSRYSRRILRRIIRYYPSLIRPIWNEILSHIWADFVWEIRSLDPDL